MEITLPGFGLFRSMHTLQTHRLSEPFSMSKPYSHTHDFVFLLFSRGSVGTVDPRLAERHGPRQVWAARVLMELVLRDRV